MQGKHLLSSLTQTMWAIFLLVASWQFTLASFSDPNSSQERTDVIPPASSLRVLPAELLLPDREVIDSPASAHFETAAYLERTGGYLGKRHEFLADTGETSAAGIVQRVAQEFSINPRLLLALLEHECHCVRDLPANLADSRNLLNLQDYPNQGLFTALEWASTQLNSGYYGWRGGALAGIQEGDGIISPLAPGLNAGSAALLFYASQLAGRQSSPVRQNFSEKRRIQIEAEEIAMLYSQMFGDPWQRARSAPPLLPADLAQPRLILPFLPGDTWSFTAGPHPAWGLEGALAALDFAPAAITAGCSPSAAWIVAAADGRVVRSGAGAVVLDLGDPAHGEPVPDGMEDTGWDLLYLHVASQERAPLGAYLRSGDRLGHPSCEGGRATGTHLHFARKYNGEWMAAGGPVPLVMDGWRALAGPAPYQGWLARAGIKIQASQYAASSSQIFREP